MRFCDDYRKLNKVTKKDSFPLPLIADTLDSLNGTSVYSTLDMKAGYWQIELHPSAREKSAFVTQLNKKVFRSRLTLFHNNVCSLKSNLENLH